VRQALRWVYRGVHDKMRQFAREQNVDLFDIGCGVCHQVIPESGRVLPGDLIVGAEFTYLHLWRFRRLCHRYGLYGSGHKFINREKNWFRVPQTFKIKVRGKAPQGVFAKDIILFIIGKLGANGCTYKSIEFYGDAIDNLSMDGALP